MSGCEVTPESGFHTENWRPVQTWLKEYLNSADCWCLEYKGLYAPEEVESRELLDTKHEQRKCITIRQRQAD